MPFWRATVEPAIEKENLKKAIARIGTTQVFDYGPLLISVSTDGKVLISVRPFLGITAFYAVVLIKAYEKRIDTSIYTDIIVVSCAKAKVKQKISSGCKIAAGIEQYKNKLHSFLNVRSLPLHKIADNNSTVFSFWNVLYKNRPHWFLNVRSLARNKI